LPDSRTSELAEVAARVAEKALYGLDAPSRRVTARWAPIPFAPELEREVLPQTEQIFAAVGAPDDIARIVATSLVAANLAVGFASFAGYTVDTTVVAIQAVLTVLAVLLCLLYRNGVRALGRGRVSLPIVTSVVCFLACGAMGLLISRIQQMKAALRRLHAHLEAASDRHVEISDAPVRANSFLHAQAEVSMRRDARAPAPSLFCPKPQPRPRRCPPAGSSAGSPSP